MGAEPSLEDVQAVVDTNVMFDIASCHDLSTSDEDDVNSVVSVYRRQRARDAVILAMLFDRDKVTTFNLWGETAELFHKIVNPSDKTSIETIFTTTFAHFTKDFVFPDWTMAVDPASQAELRSNAADQALVDIAKARGVPLITSEGFAPAGLYEAKIIKKARAAGVTVMTPRQYFTDRIDEDDATNDFMQRFLFHREAYVSGHVSSAVMRKYFGDFLTGYYRHILYGITNGHDRAVAVRVA